MHIYNKKPIVLNLTLLETVIMFFIQLVYPKFYLTKKLELVMITTSLITFPLL